MILEPFPTPPAPVLFALHQLDIVRRADPEEMRDVGDLTDLPRPWHPATCPSPLRQSVWEWCDDVVTWLNHEFAWRPALMVPICWLQHPHIAQEMPVLAILRWNTEASLYPEPAEEWHRYTLPMFSDRMASRLGESTCRTGRHQDWPAQSRHAAHTSPASQATRHAVIRGDAVAVPAPAASAGRTDPYGGAGQGS